MGYWKEINISGWESKGNQTRVYALFRNIHLKVDRWYLTIIRWLA